MISSCRKYLSLTLLLTTPVFAHGLRSAYLELSEISPGNAVGSWRTTVIDDSVTPEINETCSLTRFDDAEAIGHSRLQLHCPSSIVGKTLHIRGLGTIISEVVVRVATSDGNVKSNVLTPRTPTWKIPGKGKPWEPFLQYLRMGFDHILSGADHLLFLLGLLILVRLPRRLFLTISGFTLGHSLTLSLTTIGIFHVSRDAAEACIALSLVLLALDLDRKDFRPPSRAHAISMSLIFGLVHGLGFATALSEIGIPENAILVSLFGFNVGVELGQVMFLALGIFSVEIFRRLNSDRWLTKISGYLVGVSGSYWLWERLFRIFVSHSS